MADFPVHPSQVSAPWLSEILGVRVAAVRWEPIGTGQVGDSVRFHLEGEGLPATLAGKFAAEDATSRSTAVKFGLYRKEVEFYRRAAPQLAVRVPGVRFSGLKEDGSAFILLFEDMGPARQGDQIRGCGIADARAAIRQAAALHASSWGDEDLLTAAWHAPPPDLSGTLAALYPQAQAVWRDRYTGVIEPEMMQLCEELAELSGAYFTRTDAPQCMIHGDFRLDNMLFDIRGGAEPIAVLDWQTVTVGKAMTDVGYFMGTGIGEALWRKHEDELIELWLAEMAAQGRVLTREQIWRDYRLGILHGVSAAVFSAAFVERTERGDANFLSMARGGCSLALARDSLSALKEAL